MKRSWDLLTGCCIAAVLSSCAFDLVQVKQISARIEATHSLKSPFELEEELKVSLGTGYSRVLKKGTKWHPVGVIPSGDVYRTNDQVLTVEASNIHEAYIVVSAGKLVGFYLPVEGTFSPISDPRDLEMKEISE